MTTLPEIRITSSVLRDKLSNGLTVLLAEDHSTPTVSVDGLIKVGAYCEPRKQAGLSVLVTRMLDEGTCNHTADEISQAIESRGGSLQTFGRREFGGLSIAMLSKDFETALDLALDLIRNPVFPPARLKLEVSKAISAIRGTRDQPRIMGSNALNEILYRGTSLAHPAQGYEKTIARLKRRELVEFHRRFYTPQNTVLAVAGDFDAHRALRQIRARTRGWASSEPPAPPLPQPRLRERPTVRHIYQDKEQVHIFLGHLGIRRSDPDYYALQVTDTILGGGPGFTSRIPRRLRDEQGLAYTTYCDLTGSAASAPGRFVAYIATSPDTLQQAIDSILREIRVFLDQPVTEEELRDAKAYLTGRFVFEFQTNAQIASFLINAEIFHLGFDFVQRYPGYIKGVTVEEVQRVARQHLHPDRFARVVVGPVDRSGRLKRKPQPMPA